MEEVALVGAVDAGTDARAGTHTDPRADGEAEKGGVAAAGELDLADVGLGDGASGGAVGADEGVGSDGLEETVAAVVGGGDFEVGVEVYWTPAQKSGAWAQRGVAKKKIRRCGRFHE